MKSKVVVGLSVSGSEGDGGGGRLLWVSVVHAARPACLIGGHPVGIGSRWGGGLWRCVVGEMGQ